MFSPGLSPRSLLTNSLEDDFRSTMAQRWISISALLIALLTCSLTAVTLFICYSRVPWGDMWDYWAWYRNHQGDWLFHLAAQHNEHRLVVARLFFLFDQFCCAGTYRSVALFIPLVQLLHAVALWRLSLRVPELDKSVTWFLGAISLAAMFSSQQFANFTWYFQIQFVAVYFGATISCLALLRCANLLSATRSRFIGLGVVILLALGTTYSMANGLLVWPILLSLAFCLEMPRRFRVTLAVVGVCSWIIYFIGYIRPPDHPSPLTALLHLPTFFRFGATVLGSPFADVIAKISGGSPAGVVEDTAAFVGALGLLVALAEFYSRFRVKEMRSLVSRAEFVYWHLLSFVLLSISLIASGRYTFPITEALTSRYTTPALLFWLLLVSLLVIRAARASSPTTRLTGKYIQAVSCGAFLLFVFCDQPAKISYAHSYARYLGEAEIAIANNVFDEQAWKRVNHEMTSLLSTADFLRSKNISVFQQPWRPWLGGRLDSYVSLSASDRCAGSIDLINPITARDRPGYRIEGWVWARRERTAPRDLVFTDNTGRVVGGALSGFPRADIAVAMRDPSAINAGWIGYISGLRHSGLNAYALLPDLQACLVSSRPISEAAQLPR